MKIVCNRDKFLHAFQIAAAVAPARSPKEVLTNVKLEARDGKVTLMATDMDAGIRLELDDLQVLTPGTALLPVQKVGNILRECNDDTLTIELTENSLDLLGANSEFHLPRGNPDEFPSVVSFNESAYFEVNARLFKELVKRTAFATDIESTRYQLGGVLFEMDDESRHRRGNRWTTTCLHGRQRIEYRWIQELRHVHHRSDQNATTDGTFGCGQ
jgi:DNA polymerase-3 subunit beta